jgi:hypothetical protein
VRLGDIGQEATIDPPPKKRRTVQKSVLCLALFGMGVAALGARFGSPIIYANDNQSLVRETVVKLPFTSGAWHTLSSDDWMIALPIIHVIHPVERRTQTRSVTVVAQTKTGLRTMVGPVVADFEIPRHGAKQYLGYIGRDKAAMDAFIEGAMTIAIRSVFSMSADATIDAPIEINELMPQVSEKLADALSEAGIHLKGISLGSLRFHSTVDALIQRLRAARLRINAANDQRKKNRVDHAVSLRTSNAAHLTRIKTLNLTYKPKIEDAHTHSSTRRKAAELSFLDTKNETLLRRRTERIRSDALEYRYRKEAQALTIRIHGAKDTTQSMIKFEIGKNILPQLSERFGHDRAPKPQPGLLEVNP